MTRPRLPGRAALWSLVLLTGCSPPPRTVPVTGRVTLNGEPVELAKVIFLSSYADDHPAFGLTDADGRYELQTYFTSRDLVLGAVPGEYNVLVEKRRLPDLTRVYLKMRDIGPGPAMQRYIAERSASDIWPDGVPEGWPPGFVPSARWPPGDDWGEKAQERLQELISGYHLLPKLYASLETSPFHAIVDRSQEQWSYDFELEGVPPGLSSDAP